MTKSNDPNKPLSTIIEAQAKMAMPEIVDVFLSKYENELYEAKLDLATQIKEKTDDLDLFTASVSEKFKDTFKEYENQKMPKLNLFSYISYSPTVDWDDEVVVAKASFRDDSGTTYDRFFNQRLTKPIPAKDIEKRAEMREEISELRKYLESIVDKIANMSRKERQVKARISEMRLEEQGLQGLLTDSTMMGLIQIK